MRTIKRRRKENKTDYKKRYNLLKSGIPRIVFRKTNKYAIAQYVLSEGAQDKIIFGIDSKKLLKYGWPENSKGSLKSLSACYLTGYLMGTIILKKELEKPIVDFGMIAPLHKSKIFSFLKGLIDSGININCKKEAIPENSRIKGEHMKNKIPFEEIKTKIKNSDPSSKKDEAIKE